MYFCTMRLSNSCGTADYGINVFQSGALQVTDSIGSGFLDSAVYFGEAVTLRDLLCRPRGRDLKTSSYSPCPFPREDCQCEKHHR